MGQSTSKIPSQAVKTAIKNNIPTTNSQKTPAKIPPIGKKYAPSNAISSKLKEKYYQQRQIEQEFEKQIQRPTPAPIKVQTSFSKQDAFDQLSDSKKQERFDSVKSLLNTESFGRDLEKQAFDTNFDTTIEIQKFKSTEYSSTKAAYGKNVWGNMKRGVQTVPEIINLLTNHRDHPEIWDVPTCAEHLYMRDKDVESLTRYYELIDPDEINWLMPKEGIRYNKANKTWMTGKDLDNDPDATVKDLLSSVKNDKPLVSPYYVKELLEMKHKGDPSWRPELVAELEKTFWVPENDKKRLLADFKTEVLERVTVTGKPIARYGTSIPELLKADEEMKEISPGETALTPQSQASVEKVKSLVSQKRKSRFDDDAS